MFQTEVVVKIKMHILRSGI